MHQRKLLCYEVQNHDNLINCILVAVIDIWNQPDNWFMLGTQFNIAVKCGFELEDVTQEIRVQKYGELCMSPDYMTKYLC
jgi:hypothetical protein